MASKPLLQPCHVSEAEEAPSSRWGYGAQGGLGGQRAPVLPGVEVDRWQRPEGVSLSPSRLLPRPQYFLQGQAHSGQGRDTCRPSSPCTL